MSLSPQQLRAYVDYLRDLGVYDLYRTAEPRWPLPEGFVEAVAAPLPQVRSAVPAVTQRAVAAAAVQSSTPALSPFERAQQQRAGGRPAVATAPANFAESAGPVLPPELVAPMPKPTPFNELAPLPAIKIPAAQHADALSAIRMEIGDCTLCPLAYAGRHTIVYGDGDPNAELMFVGEGPGADEDASGVPFVGKAGQLLNNMITAMGLTREQVYIANVVKCRPPQNRAPEFVEATTCSQFLLRQIDVLQPKVIVALGATAATYLLGVRQSLASLRGEWHDCRGAKVAVTYHPAFLLRDPRQKGEAWKDLQRVMAELGLRPPVKAQASSPG